jgi:hypothetical protein
MNQLRFPHMYFDSFVELARLGLLVPALDGFEEVFVETSEGEAVSSLGTLIHQMHGEGTLLIAARRAYFEYRGLETQAKLLDGIPDVDVGFGKLRLLRWGKSEFVEYCRLNGVTDPESLYQGAIARIEEDHPLLTRPVLVKRLVEIAKTLEPDQFLGSLQPETDQFYLRFIDQIVEREARTKWIDKHGEPPQPLLTVAEHHELLGYVAEEMWLAKTASLSSDMLDSISDMFAETKTKSAATIRQVRDRIKHHALILQSVFNKNQFQFDHEDFREFFLGEQLGRYLAKGDPTDVRRLLRVEILPSWALDVAVTAVLQAKGKSAGLIDLIQKVSRADGSMSYLRENCGALAIRLMEKLGAGEVQELTLPVDSLRGRVLADCGFVRCYFRRMRLEESKLTNVRFTECEFERIDLAGDSREVQAEIQTCTFHCVVVGHDDDFYEVYDRERIRFFLGNNGFTFKGEKAPEKPPAFDVELQILQKVVNTFRRCTIVGEGTLKLRLSLHSTKFFTTLLPDLLRVGILQQVKHQGSGAQAHFRLGIRMSDVADLISDSEGSYKKFMTLAQARTKE